MAEVKYDLITVQWTDEKSDQKGYQVREREEPRLAYRISQTRKYLRLLRGGSKIVWEEKEREICDLVTDHAWADIQDEQM